MIRSIKRLLTSKWTHMALSIFAMLSALDDIMEATWGLEDLLHLDIHHGVLSLALSSMVKPLVDFFDDSEPFVSYFDSPEAASDKTEGQ